MTPLSIETASGDGAMHGSAREACTRSEAEDADAVRIFGPSLLPGEVLIGRQFMVRMTHAPRRMFRLIMAICTLGLYEVYLACFVGRFAEERLRLALTSQARLLLSSAKVKGSRVLLGQVICDTLWWLLLSFIFISVIRLFAMGDWWVEEELRNKRLMCAALVSVPLAVFFMMISRRVRLSTCSAMRAFRVHDLSAAQFRLMVRRPCCGCRRRAAAAEVRLWFGQYPAQNEMRQGDPPNCQGASCVESLRDLAGTSTGSTGTGLGGMSKGEGAVASASTSNVAVFASLVLAFCWLAALISKMYEYVDNIDDCFKQHMQHCTEWPCFEFGHCISQRLVFWHTQTGNIIDQVNFLFEILLLFAVGSPMVGYIAAALSDQPVAGVHVAVDVTRGFRISEGYLEEHVEDAVRLLADIFTAVDPEHEQASHAGEGESPSRPSERRDEHGRAAQGSLVGHGTSATNLMQEMLSLDLEGALSSCKQAGAEGHETTSVSHICSRAALGLASSDVEPVRATYPLVERVPPIHKLGNCLSCGLWLKFASRYGLVHPLQGGIIITKQRVMQVLVGRFGRGRNHDIIIDSYRLADNDVTYMTSWPAHRTRCCGRRLKANTFAVCPHGLLKLTLPRADWFRQQLEDVIQALASKLQPPPWMQAKSEVSEVGHQSRRRRTSGRTSDGTIHEVDLSFPTKRKVEGLPVEVQDLQFPSLPQEELLFHQEYLQELGPKLCSRRSPGRALSTSRVWVTSHRLAVAQGPPRNCWNSFRRLCCCPEPQGSLSLLSLRCVEGFSAEEVFKMGDQSLKRYLRPLLCMPPRLSRSDVAIKVLVNLGIFRKRKVFPMRLAVHSRRFSPVEDPMIGCDEFVELARWLGRLTMNHDCTRVPLLQKAPSDLQAAGALQYNKLLAEKEKALEDLREEVLMLRKTLAGVDGSKVDAGQGVA